MHLTLQKKLGIAAERAWEEVQTSSLFLRVITPLLRVKALSPRTLPLRWREGAFQHLGLYLLSFIPLGRHSIFHETIDSQTFTIQSRETSRLIPQWDHRITIYRVDDKTCVYEDSLEIWAGWRTPLVWLFAALFYRWRQFRWGRLVTSLR